MGRGVWVVEGGSMIYWSFDAAYVVSEVTSLA